MNYEIGESIAIPCEFTREIKQLHDFASSTKAKRRVASYDLWMRIFSLVPQVKTGTWEIRHGLTRVHMVKLSDAQRDV